ncbi:MAG: long-chain fatty acid--CoA ligase [Phycisphaerae bacterium]|nr:long-chain fatty acid--CoA ligase [Phycisphaerae bacterium]
MSLNLAFMLDQSGQAFPEQTALIIDDFRITHEQLQRASKRMAALLKAKGIARGDKVAILLPNVPQFTIAYFGILRLGAVAVTLNVLSAGDEVSYYLEDSDAKMLIAWHDFAPAATAGFNAADSCKGLLMVGGGDAEDLTNQVLATEPWEDLAPTTPDDTAVIIYTSGTTGRSKGVELTHFNLYSNAQYMPLWLQSSYPEKMELLGPGNVTLAALPLFHSFGQTCMQNSALMYGGAICYLPRWDACAAMEAIEKHKITIFAGVPTMYMSWLAMDANNQYDLSSLRATMSGGAPLPWAIHEQMKAKFGLTVLQGFGLTETSPVCCFSQLSAPILPNSSGRPIWGVEMRVVDENGQFVERGTEGEIVVRGHCVMKGYYKKPEATAEAFIDGWFRTGDIGKIDAEGNVFVIDRKKEMVLRGGFNVYPAEVERVIFEHPDIQEVAVIGVPDEYFGEEVMAIVVGRPGTRLSADDIVAHCKEHLAAYKYPRIVEFREALPKGPTGKVLKKQLVAEAKAKRAS